MARDEFPENIKRVVSQRAGGRCSFPGCDRQCWLSNSDANKASSVGVAAHINAASPGGPRYDQAQTEQERRGAENCIFLCQSHAHVIDHDEERFPASALREWKFRHEKQIAGEVDHSFALPTVRVRRLNGITFDGALPRAISQKEVDRLVEHEITVRNDSDYEYRRIGFKIQYPELLARSLILQGPAGFDGQVMFEQDKIQVSVTGGGHVKIPGSDFLGSVIVEGKGMLPGDELKLNIPSLPDVTGLVPTKSSEGDPHYYFWIHGHPVITIGTVHKAYRFSAPLFYDPQSRSLRVGRVHESNPELDPYVQVTTF